MFITVEPVQTSRTLLFLYCGFQFGKLHLPDCVRSVYSTHSEAIIWLNKQFNTLILIFTNIDVLRGIIRNDSLVFNRNLQRKYYKKIH